MSTSTSSLTYKHQNDLPKLPIPALEETCKKYLQFLEPIQSSDDYDRTRKEVERFLQQGGPELQEQLQEYAKDKASYIEDFWYEAYLNAKGSVVLNVNPFFVLEDDPTPSRNHQINRAASLTLGSLKFVHALRQGTLEPDMWRGNKALCMYQYSRLFGCARMPTADKDEAFVDEHSRHIVVLCRNQFYYFDVMWEDGVTAITERELVSNLKAIKEHAEKEENVDAASNAVGVLTTEHRATWAAHRASLWKLNSENLKVLDSALFLVCLDDTSPKDGQALASTALHGTYNIDSGVQLGTCMNRWYDKLQIIVCENGAAGVNFEHAFVDGHTVLRFVSDVYTDTIIRFAQTIRAGDYAFLKASYRAPQNASENQTKPNVMPRKLKWELTPDIQRGIKFAEAKLSDLMLQNEVAVLEFTSFGKLFITQHNMSPDAFVQIAFVAAYMFQYGETPNVYEPVLTKLFLHGRTEAARSMTKAAKHFVELFFSTDASDIAKLDALRAAIQAQVAITRDCAQGKGVERHLFALECLYDLKNKDKGAADKPGIFLDDGWKAINHSVLSTSNCGNPSLRLFGFGPVVADGFGIGYIIKDEGIQFCASSKHRQTARYLENLEKYLLRIQDLLLQEDELRFPNTKNNSKGSEVVENGSLAKKRPSMGYGFFDDGFELSMERARESLVESERRVGEPLSK